jgi:hypothetical protein
MGGGRNYVKFRMFSPELPGSGDIMTKLSCSSRHFRGACTHCRLPVCTIIYNCWDGGDGRGT